MNKYSLGKPLSKKAIKDIKKEENATFLIVPHGVNLVNLIENKLNVRLTKRI